MGVTRRSLLGGAAAFAGGALTTLGGERAADAVTSGSPLPLHGGYAPGTHDDRRTRPRHSHTSIRWSVDTGQKLVALTFDDGPQPNWTPQVLDILEAERAAATFFLVGERVQRNAKLLAGRLDRHEVANHSWSHLDLAKLDFRQVHSDLRRTHVAIHAATGREPVLMRPPYGHLGGSTALAVAELGYTMVLWSLQMLESEYLHNPPGLVEYIVESSRPGTIVLAHDTGPADRLVAIRNLPRMIAGLRKRGFELVTVSQLLEAEQAAPATAPTAEAGPAADTPAALSQPGR